MRATIYRSYETEIEFDPEVDAPEMIDNTGKAEWISRKIPIDQWQLVDVAVDLLGE
jgi:hypothetical protein